MSKFYMVVGPAGKPVYTYNAVEFEKAERAAKKAASDSREEVYVMTATHIVQAPVPEATVTAM